MLDLLITPEEFAKARQYFDQQKCDTYKPLVTAADVPAIQQLGIDYPNPPTKGIRRPAGAAGSSSRESGG